MKQLILRHEAQPDGTDATISVIYQQSPTHNGSVAGPFPFVLDYSEDAHEKVRWYLEEYLLCPLGAYRNRAEEAEKELQALGEKLFHAVFSQPECYRQYMRVADELNNARIVVQANSAAGIALPWEAIRDPQRTYGQLAYEANAFVRGEADLDRIPVALEGDRLNVLLAISRPRDEKDVPFQSVARHLLHAFSAVRERVHIELLRPATFEELARRLQEKPGHYHVFHFDGHGVYHADTSAGAHRYGEAGGSLYFEDGERTGREVGAALAAAKVPLVLLNACQSGMTRAEDNVVSLGNDLLRSGASGVVAMSYSVYVQTAAKFMKRLYERLRDGDTLAGAHKKAIAELHANPERTSALGTKERLQDWIVPVLFEAAQVTPLPKRAGLNLGGGSEESAGTAAEMNVPATPLTGFFGRDNVILRLERIYQNNTVALLWGMAGVGKTTTASEFARWRGLTGALEGPIFFFSFEHRKTLADVLREIGTFVQPLLKANGVEWEHLTPQRQRRCVLDLLTQIPCFLIWDNFEPVSGFPTGSKSDWTDEEQAELKQFLLDLARGNGASKVLITSRREKEALLSDFPAVPLDGLSHSEALELAGAIFEKQGLNSAAIRKLPQFDNLLKFMKGNPLTLQVILPLLKEGKNPEELLRELEAGTLKLPESDSVEQGRDKSLTASLTYRLNALPEADVARLSVLGLFQGFVNAQVLANISAQENAPLELRDVSVEDWTRILSSAAEIGLGRIVGKGYFTIHPALPWFFHERLADTFGERLPELEHLFVKAFGGYAYWLDKQFSNNPEFSINIIGAEELNLLHAFQQSYSEKNDVETADLLYGLKRLWKTQGRWEELEYFLRKIENEVRNTSGGPLEGREHLWSVSLGMRQEIAQYQRDFDSAKDILARLKDYYESIGDHKNIAATFQFFGIIAQECRDFDVAKSFYLQSLEIAKIIGDDYRLSGALHQLGRIAEEQYDFDEAEKWYQQSLEIHQSIGNESRIAVSLHALGIIAEERNEFDKAEGLCLQSLKIQERIGDQLRIAQLTHQLGIIAHKRREFDKAEKWYRQSLDIKLRIGNKYGAAMALHQLGKIAEDRGDFNEAEKWYQQSLKIEMDVKDEKGVAETLHQLGIVAHCQGNYAKAEKLYLQSLEFKMRINDEHGVAVTIYQLGMLAEYCNHFSVAEERYRQAERVFIKLSDNRGLNLIQKAFAHLEQLRQENPQ